MRFLLLSIKCLMDRLSFQQLSCAQQFDYHALNFRVCMLLKGAIETNLRVATAFFYP